MLFFYRKSLPLYQNEKVLHLMRWNSHCVYREQGNLAMTTSSSPLSSTVLPPSCQTYPHNSHPSFLPSFWLLLGQKEERREGEGETQLSRDHKVSNWSRGEEEILGSPERKSEISGGSPRQSQFSASLYLDIHSQKSIEKKNRANDFFAQKRRKKDFSSTVFWLSPFSPCSPKGIFLSQGREGEGREPPLRLLCAEMKGK